MGYNTNRLASELDIHPNTLRSYERGERAMDDEVFVKACILLDVDAAEVLSAACLSKLPALRDLEERLRSEMGRAPRKNREHDKLVLQRFNDLRRSLVHLMDELLQFWFEHVRPRSGREKLYSLLPDWLKEFLQEQDEPEVKRTRRRGSRSRK